MFIEVLTEGTSDVPAVLEVLTRKFRLVTNVDFRIHPHRGRGKLPANPLARPDKKQFGLLDQLPAKLRGFGRYMDEHSLVLVLIDVDDDDCRALLQRLQMLLNQLPHKPPKILFRLAIEETESWFIADPDAVKRAFSSATISIIRDIPPDAIIGAWEKLAECIGEKDGSPPSKLRWAQEIVPYLDLDNPRSPSLRRFISGLQRELGLA